MDTNLERSVEEQRRFQYYWTALTFTLLAASVQSANLAEYNFFSYLLEITGWLSLLTSGLLLLKFLESRGRNMRALGLYEQYEESKPRITADEKNKLLNLREAVDINRTEMASSYEMARFVFTFGLVTIILGRAIHGFILIAT